MTDRLISADALKKEIVDWKVGINPKNQDYAAGYFSALSAVEGMLAYAPTVDAKPVVHGEWSTIEDDYCGLTALKCSECNQEYWFEDEPPMKIYSYCPNCGARMDGDGNG